MYDWFIWQVLRSLDYTIPEKYRADVICEEIPYISSTRVDAYLPSVPQFIVILAGSVTLLAALLIYYLLSFTYDT